MAKKKKKVVVLAGSKSDLPQLREGINLLRIAKAERKIDWLGVEICSAHRNSAELRKLLGQYKRRKVDIIIACAGKLAALFGDVDAHLRNERKNSHTRVITVPLKSSKKGIEGEEASMAAYLSAKQVPNSQFIFRQEFFDDPATAFEAAINEDFPELVLEEQKPPESLSPNDAYEISRLKLPEMASYETTIEWLERGGFYHLYTGKTRETFMNPRYPDLLFVLATDRISIFDIVLNTLIPEKGAILTAMTISWLTRMFPDVPNHLVAYGKDITKLLPRKLKKTLEYSSGGKDYLMKHMLVVKKCDVLKVEAIVRGNLTGSGWEGYQQNGKVCGIKLPLGLQDGSRLESPIFTPSTKAPYGLHDENISFSQAAKIIGRTEAEKIRNISLYLFEVARNMAEECGIIIADTKFEFGIDPKNGKIILVDEVLTPDSSRFWSKDKWKEALEDRVTPPSFDKQPVRDAGKKAGVKKDPGWVPSDQLILETRANYHKALELLSGMELETFWEKAMKIIRSK